MHFQPCMFTLLLSGILLTGQVGGTESKDNWVVITSIAPPTPAVIRLSSLPDWQVVVVADKKTPNDWFCPGVQFLSVEKQESLGFKTSRLVPWNSYGRKNIGYLWAIAQGAKVIYETDDDNLLVSESITVLEPGYYAHFVVNSSQRTINVYDTYGLPDMWPRGLPLEDVKTKAPTLFRKRFTLPLIQQGLANHDPDVDAIYRLTQPLGVNFSSKVFTTIIPKGAMCPFNSQNTVFLQNALWSLLLPVTTTMRVCDIWRGYWAQRLLWEIGGRLSFIEPTVVQHRNVHTLKKDYVDELDLYQDAGRLVTFLQNWAFHGSSLPQAIVQLSQDMATAGFWLQGDADLASAWVEDLTTIGYTWPALVKEDEGTIASPAANARNDTWDPIIPTVFTRMQDITLVVMYNVPVPASVPQIVQRMYQPIFRKVVHTGFVISEEYGIKSIGMLQHLDWVDCRQHGGKKGWFMQECLARAMHVHAASPSGGYLLIGDDTLLDICLLATAPRDKLWTSGPLRLGRYPEHGIGKASNSWWQRIDGRNRTLEDAVHVAAHSLEVPARILGHNATHVYGLNGTHLTRFWWSKSCDFLYIPERLRIDYIGVSMSFAGQDIFAEVTNSHMIGLLVDGNQEKYETLTGRWIWGKDRTNITQWGLMHDGLADRMAWVHSIKLSRYREHVTRWWEELTCPSMLLDNSVV